MAYLFFLNHVLLPVTPSKIEIKTKSKNQTINLINEGDVNILKKVSLREVTFEALLPRKATPFTTTQFVLDPSVYLVGLEATRIAKTPFQFIIIRTLPDGNLLVPTNLKCTLEDYTIIEDAKDGLDVRVKINLKEYRPFGLKEVTIVEETKTATTVPVRAAETAPIVTDYTVEKGDCLWNIAKSKLGDGSRWKEIFNLNKNIINDPNLIHPGQVLKMP